MGAPGGPFGIPRERAGPVVTPVLVISPIAVSFVFSPVKAQALSHHLTTHSPHTTTAPPAFFFTIITKHVSFQSSEPGLLTQRPARCPLPQIAMDYSSYFPENYQSLTAANLQAANSAFQVAGQQQQRPQQSQNGQMPQLPQDMFFLNDDPFDAKMEAQARAGEIDLSSKTPFPAVTLSHMPPPSSGFQGDVSEREIDDGVDDSDNLFDDLDDISRLGTVHQATAANHSPLDGSISYLHPGQQDFELLDQNEMSGNSTKRKAQNRAAQRAFRERKERHLKDLQAKTQELEQATNLMNDENARLKAQLQALEMENSALKGQNITFSFPVPPPPSIDNPDLSL